MKKIQILLIFIIMGVFNIHAVDERFYLNGRVKTAVTGTDLTNAYVILYDSIGNVTDSIRANKGLHWRGMNEVDTVSNFSILVARKDTVIVFDVVCEGFKPQTITYALTNIKKRESYREMPIIYMERAPRQLKEVTVTATKIKFYNKGDTTVYDASAFELAEGSMLDALIAQLPGVELSTDGQIKVNGQFVESLLLDGKQFFDGDNNLMLENIAAYTVKNIQVYEGEKKKDVQMGIQNNKVLTMDVRLKKEYNIGWIINLQGGYGTENRYLGRAFASWFNPKWRVSLVGNANNLNDNRVPGRNDTWTPEMMPSGKKEFRRAGINYNFSTFDEKTNADGALMFYQAIDNVERNTDRINFLQGGNTYERSYSNTANRQISVTTSQYFFHRNDKLGYGVSMYGTYMHAKNSDSNLSGTFDKDPGDMTREVLEAIYSSGSSELLENVINRSKTSADGWANTLSGYITPFMSYRLSDNDRFNLSFQGDYRKVREELWKDYDINYGGDPVFNQRLRQYFDNSPNYNSNLGVRTGYSTRFRTFYLTVAYEFTHKTDVKDSYMYALDRLNDMGIYGILPPNYLMSFDPENSYASRLVQNNHRITPDIGWIIPLGEAYFNVLFSGTLSFINRKFTYWRNDKDYKMSVSNTLYSMPNMWTGMLEYKFGKYGEERIQNYRNQIRYSFILDPTLPDLFDMVDVVNDADPLNIYYGNPDLKTAVRKRHQFWWFYRPQSHTFKNDFSVSYTSTSNELTRGYTYDTSTGVRYNKMYNVDGNHNFSISDNVEWQFGRTKQFTLTYTIDAGFSQATDMIGVNKEMPELRRIHNSMANQRFKLTWQIGKQNIGVRCDAVTRHTTSRQAGFNTLNANHVNAGVQGVFTLPAGFGISTDFTCYTRRGYGVDYLDTTDPVWNLRLTYAPPRNSHWVFMLDGFDMLHQLSNVNYAVTASGRTVSYTNSLPRYMLLSVQYRLNIQPKKR